MPQRTGIDEVLKAATDRGDVPGVVAMAAIADGPVYEGAFGVRRQGGDAAMTVGTVFRIASMTKAITCVAAMQLVEQGRLTLDGPLPDIDTALSAPQVLTGFDAAGKPQLRPAKRPITLKHLLTHTAGFCYEQWNLDLQRCVAGARHAADGQRQARGIADAADVRSRRPVGVRH